MGVWTKQRCSMKAGVLMATPCPNSLHGKHTLSRRKGEGDGEIDVPHKFFKKNCPSSSAASVRCHSRGPFLGWLRACGASPSASTHTPIHQADFAGMSLRMQGVMYAPPLPPSVLTDTVCETSLGSSRSRSLFQKQRRAISGLTRVPTYTGKCARSRARD